MTEEERELLRRVREAAPYTWRQSSFYYEIAEKYGIPEWQRDDLRDEAMDRWMKQP